MADTQDQRQRAIEAIKQAQHLLIIIGKRPSGDQIGSLLALAKALASKGKDVYAVASDGIAEQYSFLDGNQEVAKTLQGSKDFIIELGQNNAQADNLAYKLEKGKLKITITPTKGNFKPDDVNFGYGDYQYDLVITLGVRELSQLGPVYQADPGVFFNTKLINIDNNPKNQSFGKLNWLDNKASSIAEMMVSVLESLEIPLTPTIATYLLTGLMMATDRFQTANTTAKALTTAAQLTAAGANRDLIVGKLFKATPYLFLKTWGRIMENLRIDPNLKLAWSILSQREISELAMTQESIRQGLDRLLTLTEEAEIIALIQETSQGAKISLRSKGNKDVSKIAKQFQGGGQPTASGYELAGEDFLNLTKQAVQDLKQKVKGIN